LILLLLLPVFLEKRMVVAADPLPLLLHLLLLLQLLQGL
jgi:hypothetical protein